MLSNGNISNTILVAFTSIRRLPSKCITKIKTSSLYRFYPKCMQFEGAKILGWQNCCRYSSSAVSRPQTKLSDANDPPKYEGEPYENIVSSKTKHITPAAVPYYKKPLLISSAKMQYIYDHNGRRYLDMFAGIVTVSVGHCHPKVNGALHDQIERLWHTTGIYMQPKIVEYAEKLAATLPGNLKNVYFVNSGSEANDLAVLLARLYTKNYDILSLRNAYHGGSLGTMGLTAHAPWRFPIPGINNGIHNVMNPDPYVGIWGGKNCRDSPVQSNRNCDCGPNGCQASDKYYEQFQEIFKYSLPKGKVAGFFAEAIQGVGGTVQYPRGYLKRAVETVRSNGGIYIADEVQTGFGRTGEHFWGFQGHDVMPDIVTMAKGIGNGFPIGAVVTTPEIANTIRAASHFNTFGGNPLACSVGIAVLDVIQEENLQQNSLEVGTYYLKSLEKVRNKYEIVGDVRGKGLMIGVELVESKETRAPLNMPTVLNIWEQCKDYGVLFGRGGLNGNVFRIKPPMCITKEDVDVAVDALDKSIATFSK